MWRALAVVAGVGAVGGLLWWGYRRSSAHGGVLLPNSPMAPKAVPLPTEYVTQRSDVPPKFNPQSYVPGV